MYYHLCQQMSKSMIWFLISEIICIIVMKTSGKKRTAILPSIGVGIPTRHVSTVRTIDSFDTGESQRSKCPRVKDRPWESPPCRENLALCKQTPATKWKQCFTVHYLFSHGSRLCQVELPFLSHREMRNFDKRLLISALRSLIRLRRNWTDQLRQKLMNLIQIKNEDRIKILFSWFFYVIRLKSWHSRCKKVSLI